MKAYIPPLRGALPLAVVIVAAALVAGIPGIQAADPQPRGIPVKMGDYRFSPDEINVAVGETVRLELTNTDSLTPHNFTLQAREAGMDVDVNVNSGSGKTVEITPQAPGRYTFFCDKKLPFMKSHRDRGMQGTLVVAPR